MTFKIDTGQEPLSIQVVSAMIDGSIDLQSQPQWAERAHRKVIELIQGCEDTNQLDEYWKAETILLDGFYMNYPEYWDAIKEAHIEHRALIDPKTKLPHGNTDPAEPGNSLGIKF